MMIGLLILPIAAGCLLWLSRKNHTLSLMLTVGFSVAHLVITYLLCQGSEAISYSFAPYGFELWFRIDSISRMYLLVSACMFVLLALYTVSFCRGKKWGGAYQFFLWLSLSMLDGALLSDHMALTLFFWEGLLCTLFAMLLLRNLEKPDTAIKALILAGTADLLLMLGIVLTIHAAGTARISEIHHLPISGWGAVGFGCLLAGALGKAGSVPFHSWIPDAAVDAPTPFLAAFPGSLEKTAGIYLASRIVTGLYDFHHGSVASTCVMIVGAVTLLYGVSMALIQKDLKRLLSWHAISQVGYIILGLGSGEAIGVAGGVYHLLNNVLYKTGLFMVAGILEKQAGTTDLHDLGGLRKKLPLTTVSAVIFALSIAGFPGTNGFTSKELIFDAALETHPLFYIAALLGAFMTTASFLKFIRSAFFGKTTAPQENVREAGPAMLIPTVLLALACIVCSVYPVLPLDQWIGGAYGFEESFATMPKSPLLVGLSCAVLALALADHIYGSRRDGSALKAADHLHYAPGMKQYYRCAERGTFDPYRWLMGAADVFSRACAQVERGISWLYDTAIPGTVKGIGNVLSHFNTGSLSRYLALAVCGLIAVALIFYLV